jgi:hypothetical protein
MPGMDRTGPMGKGPMTGRAAGCCRDEDVLGPAQTLRGGSGRGHGGGRRGWRHWFRATGRPGWMRGAGFGRFGQTAEPDPETRTLKQIAAGLQTELDAVRRRLDALETRRGTP